MFIHYLIAPMANRIAVINPDKCKPKKCNLECKTICPVVRMGKLCVEVTKTSKCSSISESLCIGCGMCATACPFNAIQIVKIPTDLKKDTVHRYGKNGFRLYHLPMPKQGKVVGLLGENGIGKSTVLKILGNKIRPNFESKEEFTDKDIITKFRGTDLQKYFTKLYKGQLEVKVKPQIPKNATFLYKCY